MFGHWFGRPYDNIHQLVDVGLEDDEAVVLQFEHGEHLRIWMPAGTSVSAAGLVIAQAHRVRWDWFLYGYPPTEQNHRTIDHRVEVDGLARRLVTSEGGAVRAQAIDGSAPAVSLRTW